MKRITYGVQPFTDPNGRFYMDNEDLLRPVDRYEHLIPGHLLQAASDYQLLLVPSMGQHAQDKGGGWCGRTCASMIYNYQALAKVEGDADPLEHYIKMCKKNGVMNQIKPDGSSAWGPGGMGYSGELTSAHSYEGVDHLRNHLDPNQCAQSKGNPDWVRGVFEKAGFLSALDSCNPVMMFTRFSTSQYMRHAILFSGYLTLGGDLWFLILNPATFNHAGKFYEVAKLDSFSSKEEVLTAASKVDVLLTKQIGDWNHGLGAIAFLKAKVLFNPYPGDPTRLLYDGNWDSPTAPIDRSKGSFQLRRKPHAVPDELVLSQSVKSVYGYPFALGSDAASKQPRESSPLGYYAAVERMNDATSAGGFFPVGLEALPHAGVHLRSPTVADLPVKASYPGEVVAFRMGARGAADDSSVLDKIQVTQGNWANFVLLRHTLEVGKTTKEQQEFYSLYMHLAPPSWWQMSAMKSPGTEVDVPWLWKWVIGENGVLIKIRESKDDRFPIGVPLPLQAKIPPESLDGVRIVVDEDFVQFNAFDSTDGNAITLVAVPKSTSLDDAVWIYLPPPPHIKLVCEALRSGSTVFLDGQFLSVKQGESIGLVGAFQPDGTVIKAQDASVAARKGLSSNFIHWECFAKDEQIFKKLADPFSKHGFKFESLTAPAYVEPATETDPFFKYKDYADSLRKLLKTQPAGKATEDKPAGDKAAEPSSPESSDGFPEVGPEGPGTKFVQQIESFFETTSVGLLDRVLLHLNVKDAPKPSQYRVKGAAGSVSKYRLNVSFLQGSIASTDQKPLIVGEESFVELEDKDWTSNPVIEKEAVFVPKQGYSIGDVDLLRITDSMGGAYQLVLQRSKIDWKGFQSRTEVLWRNLLLTHDSDWVPDVAKHFIKDKPKASDNSNTAPAEEVVVKPTDVGWWNDQAVVLKAGVKLPEKLESIAKGAPSFLGDGKGIVSVHPVTLKWMLEYIIRSEEQQAQFLSKEIHQSLPTADRKSYFRTLVPMGYKDLRNSPCGGSLTVIALDNLYYASGKDGAAAIRLKPKLPGVAPDVIVEVPFGGYGVALKEISLDVWGDWELSLADRSEDSKEWIDADGVKTFDFSIAPPELDLEKLAQEAYQPKATGHDEFSWLIPWKSGVHCSTYGGMVELVLISGSQKIPTGIGVVPKTSDHHRPKSKLVELGKDDPKLWKLEDGSWIVPDQKSDKDAKITANFSFSEWNKAAKGTAFRLHQKLACAVQDLRELGKSLTPKVLSESGLEASLKVSDSQQGEKLKRAGLASGLFETIELTKASRTETWIRLVVSDKEVNETGLDFDLSHALELLADSAVVKAMDRANAAAGLAGDVSAASSMVGKAASLDSQGSKVSKGAGKVSDATGKAAAHKTGEFTVAFHFLPKHFLRMSECSDGLVTASEWARYLKDYPTYVAIPPGTTAATPDASSAMSSAKGFISEKAGELTGKVSSFMGVSETPNPVGDALASVKPASPICIVAANPIGSLGSQSFSEPKISQVFPDKPEGDLKLKVTAKLTGGPKIWKGIDVRLRGDVGGGTIEITGSKGADEAVFLFPWPSGSGSSFDAKLCGVPVTMQGNLASSMIPRALDYEIHLRPDWERLQPVMTFIKNDLVFNLTVLGLKGSSSKAFTTNKSGKSIKLSPTQQAEKVSIEAFHEGEKIVLPIKGMHPFSGEGFTYADAGFKLDLRVVNLKKAKPGKISITLSAAGKRHRFLFDWDGRTIPSGDGIMIFDPDQPDPSESVPTNQSEPQSGQESEPEPAPDVCEPDEPEAPNPFRFYELNPDFMTTGVHLD